MRRLMLTLSAVALFATTAFAEPLHKQPLDLSAENAPVLASIFTITSSIGALDFCERELKYKITGKTDEVAMAKLVTVFDATPPNAEYQSFFAFLGNIVQASARTGTWLVAKVVTEGGVNQKIDADKFPADIARCGVIEAYLRDQMATGILMHVPAKGFETADDEAASKPLPRS